MSMIEVLGPAEAPLSVIRGRHRYRLLVKATREADLQAYLRLWLTAAPKPKGDDKPKKPRGGAEAFVLVARAREDTV